MEIILQYSITTKENVCVPLVEERFTCDASDDASKEPARDRYKELFHSSFVSNLKYKIVDEPVRRVINARYAPNGKVYTFEVDFEVRKNMAVEVDDIQFPDKRVYVVAIDKDHEEKVIDIEKRFPIQYLRKAYKPK